MTFHQSGFGFSIPLSEAQQRHCFVRPTALRALLESPGSVELLLDLLGGGKGDTPAGGTREDPMRQLRRRAIHLAVRPDSPFYGQSIEEILLLTAYTSKQFEETAWKREVARQPDEREIDRACRKWIQDRSAAVRTGRELGARWRLAGCMFGDDAVAEQIVFAIAFALNAHALARDIDQLAAEGSFVNEPYVACSPATALDYLVLSTRYEGGMLRWDASVLERTLRRRGLGLLLIDGERVALCVPPRRSAAL